MTTESDGSGAIITTAPRQTVVANLLQSFLAGQPAALARAVSLVENQRDGFEDLLASLHSRVGRARRIGITGPPGAGKSTLTARLVDSFRGAGLRVGVIAVDPTSPFTGGALLGDRIRMESVALDPGVFIRSLATRGSLGGISGATRAVSDLVDAFGFDRILIETVGVGQSELDISRAGDATVVMLVPESGDSIQALKAGLMEIGDLFVVNKADRPGADRVRNDIELMIGMRRGMAMRNIPAHHGLDLRTVANPGRAARAAAAAEQPEEWIPPVLTAVATKGEGIDALVSALDRHFRYLETSGELKARRRRRLREQVVDVVEHRARRRLWSDERVLAHIDAELPRMERGEQSPYGIANEILKLGANAIAGTNS